MRNKEVTSYIDIVDEVISNQTQDISFVSVENGTTTTFKVGLIAQLLSVGQQVTLIGFDADWIGYNGNTYTILAKTSVTITINLDSSGNTQWEQDKQPRSVLRFFIINKINERIYLREDVAVPLNRGLQDIRDLSKRKGGFSKTIIVDGTKHNNKVLSHLYDVNVVEGNFNPKTRVECRLIQNEVTVFEGTLRLLAVNRSSQSNLTTDQKVQYEVSINDETAEFFNRIEGNLNNIDLSFLNHTWDADEVINSQTNTHIQGYKYLFNKSFSDYENETIELFFSGSPIPNVAAWSLNQFYPSIYARLLFDIIVAETGYSYTWESANTDIINFNKLIIPSTAIDVKKEDGWFPPYNNTATNNGFVFDDVIPIEQAGSIINLGVDSAGLNVFLPTMSKKDFIQSIMLMFNLYIIPDEDNPTRLIIKRRDDFYDEGVRKDWTKLLDPSKNITINDNPDIQASEQEFTYTQGKAIPIEEYFNVTGDVSGKQTIKYTDVNLRGEAKTEIKFNPFMNTEYLINSPGQGDFIRPVHNEPYNSGDTYIVYDTSLPYKQIFNQIFILDIELEEGGKYTTEALIDNGQLTNPINIIITEVSHLNKFNNPTVDLNFGKNRFYALSSINPDTLTRNNLFNLHWRRNVDQLDTGKLLTAYFNINEVEFFNIRLNDKLWVRDKWWNIYKIKDYDANSSKPTKVELISIDNNTVLTPFLPPEMNTFPEIPTGQQIENEILTWEGDFYVNEDLLPILGQITMNGNTLLGDEGKWLGGVLHPVTNNIYGIPHNAQEVLIIDTTNDEALTGVSVGQGLAKWAGGVLAQNGLIYFIPYNSNKVLIYDAITNTIVNEIDLGIFPSVNGKWFGGTLGLDGKIYCTPANYKDMLVIDPSNNNFEFIECYNTNAPLNKNRNRGAVLATDNKIYFAPYTNTDPSEEFNNEIKGFNVDTQEFFEIPIIGSAGNRYQGACLIGDNKIVFIQEGSNAPLGGAPKFLIYNYINETLNIESYNASGLDFYTGGCLITPNRKVIGVPQEDGVLVQLDNNDNINQALTENIDGVAIGNTPGINKFNGAILHPNGKVYFIPYDTTVLIRLNAGTNFNPNICVSPHLNKY